MGWYVQGSRLVKSLVGDARAFVDENSITATHAPSLDSPVCVLGDVDGQVSLLPFPSSAKSPILSQTRVLTGKVDG